VATETVELGYQQLLAIVLQATAAVEAHGKELVLLHGQIAELSQRLSALERPQNGKKDDHGCDALPSAQGARPRRNVTCQPGDPARLPPMSARGRLASCQATAVVALASGRCSTRQNHAVMIRGGRGARGVTLCVGGWVGADEVS
jgi:hypothetical protein